MGMDVRQVRLLGPVDVVVDGVARPVSGRRRKTVLAVLTLYAGDTVSTDRLIDAVWGAEPPATAANTLQRHISYLRGVLGSRDAIVARAPGYLLALPPGATDVGRAEQLIRRSGQTGDAGLAATALREALGLWRGPSLADVVEVPWLHEPAERLEQLRLDATQALIDARLALGESAQLVPELERMVEQHPFRENFHRQLMLALYRSGRQADALAAYQRLRQAMLVELGIDPSPALRELEAAILRQDATLTAAAAPPVGAAPAQLPMAVPTFTGREADLARLHEVLAGAQEAGAAVTIATVSGTAGVGKTALAVHWAHQVATHFPDGHLYVNLRGFDPGGAMVEPAEAIRGFLDAFGVAAERIPTAPDAQASFYRSVVAAKRLLFVLDNARDEEQVRPLLPGAGHCLVVVTSRNELTGLTTTEGARPLTLDRPSTSEARAILASRLGVRRVDAESRAVADIIARCARLPLALAVAAARAAAHPELPLTALAAQLHDTAAALDPFHGHDAATDVRAVFSWSYHTLTPEGARLFRLLGLAAGPDIGLPGVASLLGLPIREARRWLGELVHGHLVNEPVAGRFALHDLLRAYAIELTQHDDDDADRALALHRLLDHYLHSAFTGALALAPSRDPIKLVPPLPGVTVTSLPEPEAAMAWFATEHPLLLAAVAQELEGRDWRPWQLAWTLKTFLERRGYWHDNATVQRIGLRAAVHAGDEHGQAYAHRFLSTVDTEFGRYRDADAHNEEALRLFEAVGDHIGQAHTHMSRAWAAEQQGHFAEALRHAQHAITLYSVAEHRPGHAHALNTVGFCHAQLGEYALAQVHCERALALFDELGDGSGAAGTLDSLGFVQFRLGEPERAAAYFHRAIDLYRAIGHVYGEGEAYANLGDGYEFVGDLDSARQAWRRAVAILDGMDHPVVLEVRAKLRLSES
jgi:DNA-binding SARP family transcriptional activator